MTEVLPDYVADALIRSTLQDVETLIERHGLSEVLVALAMYCNVQTKAKLNKPGATDRELEVGYYFRDAAKALEVAASLTYRTQEPV
ncbi:MAG: hypothetical protein Q6K99_10845 [Thermostichales cyanobacterium BF4_bins_65]